MNRPRAIVLALRLLVLGFAWGGMAFPQAARAQAPVQPDQQEMARGDAAEAAGKYQEAADLYSGIEAKYPTSPLVPAAILRLGYVYFRVGDYDRALTQLKRVPTLKNVTPEATEMALSLSPQVLSARSSALKPGDPVRQSGFEEAVKGFDHFLDQYPKSSEFEAANYGKAAALYQVAKYAEGIAALKINLQRFPQSENMLDSKYLFALTTGTLANVSAQKGSSDAANEARYDLAEKTLNEIIAARTDVALANDARFQIGEILFFRAGFLKDKKAQQAMFDRALGAYRQVAAKEAVVESQKARVEAFKARRAELLRTVAANPGNLEIANKQVRRLIEREQEKLSAIEARPDQTLTARLKAGEIYFQLGRLDESRTVFNFLQPFLEDEQQKKEAAYFNALSLASQNAEARGENKSLAEKTEEAYRNFIGAHKGDAIADNLALVLGIGFLNGDTEKAIRYFEESLADYPRGHFRLTTFTQEAGALMRLGRYDQALGAYQKALADQPEPEMAAVAEYGIASVYQKTGQVKEALAAFKTVREKYPGSEQGEQAAFWHGQVLGESGNASAAITELSAFLQNFPKSDLAPSGYYYLAGAQAATGKKDAALATYTKLAHDFPKAEVAPFSYLQRGQLLMGEQKWDEVVAVMRELIKAYPDGAQLYQAYDYLAQIYASQQKVPEQIATYEEFVKAKPASAEAAPALLHIATLWKDQANRLGRFIALNDEQKGAWKKDLEASMGAVERLLQTQPESSPVALALKTLLEVQKLRQGAHLLSEPEVEKYFQELAARFEGQPGTRSKVLFTLAASLSEKNPARAGEIMRGAYDEKLKYAPGDLDLYGSRLIEQKNYEEAKKVYEKLGRDYPLPANALGADGKVSAPQDIQEAQAVMLFGLGKILQEQKQDAEAGQLFARLEKLYGWSPKNLEGSYGIALSLYQQKKYDEALKRLLAVIKASTAPPELRAQAMLLLARCHEEQQHFEVAIDNYLKIGKMFGGVPAVAAEGLWRGASLLERQGHGEIPMPTPMPVISRSK